MDLRHWQRALKEAGRELDAATKRSDVNAAAQRLMRAKAELKRLRAARPTRPAFDDEAGAAAS